LCEPSSELHIAEDWYRRTALSDLLQLDEAQVNKDRLYRALDELLVHKAALEAHLSKRCGELFARENEVLLYDVTSTYFEGQALANPLAQRGYSRDHRPDCKQVCIALVVSFDGFPLGYEVFAGNTHDSRTVQTIVTTMEARHGVVGRVWIADRGMSSAANLSWLRESHRRYIIGAPKSELKKFSAALAATAGWRKLREGSRSSSRAAPRRTIRSSYVAPPNGASKNGRCTRSSVAASRWRFRAWPGASSVHAHDSIRP
jgi:transposase